MTKALTVALYLASSLSAGHVSGFAFIPSSCRTLPSVTSGGLTPSDKTFPASLCSRTASRTSLSMLDQNVIQGAGIALAGLAVGIGLVAFTEAQGERAKERGSGLSEGMSTRIAGQLMEDVEVSSVQDLGSLTSQLEQALKESGGADEEELEMSEEDKKRIEDEADDGW